METTRREFILGGTAATLTPTELLAQRRERLTPENWSKIIEVYGKTTNKFMPYFVNELERSKMVSQRKIKELRHLIKNAHSALLEEVVTGYSMNNTPYVCFPRLQRYLELYFYEIDRLLNTNPSLLLYFKNKLAPDKKTPIYTSYQYLKEDTMKFARYFTIDC